MRQILNVDTKNYNIIISDEDFSVLVEEINKFTAGQKRLFVFSKKVYKLYKDVLNIPKAEILVLNDGEKEKNFTNYIKILEKAQELGLSRKDVLIAFGGGVVGDMTGFAASTYMRGIDYIQVPTTLLSMVDSSVGGKTAIDLNGIKNIVGSFYQPKRVFININFLKTLDKRQYLSGVGEILKYAFIEENCGHKFSIFLFEYLTLCSKKILDKDPQTLIRVIDYCLQLKIAVINQDEKEAGLRKILNLGHTYGHALESLGKYKKYTHGEAIIQGMFFILNYAYSKNIIPYSYYRMSVDLLSKYGFKRLEIPFSSEDMLNIIRRDKKASGNEITFIVPSDRKQVTEIKLSYDEVLNIL